MRTLARDLLLFAGDADAIRSRAERRGIMAKASVRKPVATIRNEGAQVIRKLRRDAEALVARGRAEVMKDVRAVRSSADRAVRDLERRVVRQFHAATEDQLKRLERRVAKLERLVAQISAKTTVGERAA
jgi:hypothetical protein